MLSRKNIYIIIGVIVAALVAYGIYSWYSVPSQEQPSNGSTIEEETGQEEPETGDLDDNTPNNEEEEPAANQGGLIICLDQCGDGFCLTTTCTDDINCPCPETPEDCPQDCGQ